MRVELATFPAMGFDTVSAFDDTQAAEFYRRGFRYHMGYLGSMTPERLAIGFRNGLAFIPVTFSRAPDWPGATPSIELGQEDGNTDVAHLRELGIPLAATVITDLEGAPSRGNLAGWLDARSHVQSVALYDPGLYVGSGAGMSGQQLYLRPYIHNYMKSLSTVPEPVCGWNIIQLYKTVTIADVEVDVQVIQYDYKNRLPSWVVN